MATNNVLQGWKYLGGKDRRYKNEATGQELSRRQYDKLAGRLSYEAKARHNKLINPELSVIRPARGRKSYVKSEDWIKKEIAAQRIEAEALKKKAEAAAKKEKEIARKNERLVGKKIKVKKVAKRYFPKGRIGWRIPFNTYADYRALLKDAKATGAIFAYGLGYVAVDERIGDYKTVTVFPMRSLSMVEDEEDFYTAMFDSLEQYSYLKLAHYFIHFAIDKKQMRL